LNLESAFPAPAEHSQQTRYYLPKDEALKQLKAKTGQDFGHDTAGWRSWLREQGKL